MAPAGSYESLAAAIKAGANSVYFGVEQLNMRAKAANNFTTADLPEVVRLCEEKNVKTYLNIIEQSLGVKPIIYTSEKYWKTYLPKAEWGCDYLLWLDNLGTIWPQQLWPWAGWTFWQYSYQARLPGISTNLGLNYFNGSKKELQQMVIQ